MNYPTCSEREYLGRVGVVTCTLRWPCTISLLREWISSTHALRPRRQKCTPRPRDTDKHHGQAPRTNATQNTSLIYVIFLRIWHRILRHQVLVFTCDFLILWRGREVCILSRAFHGLFTLFSAFSYVLKVYSTVYNSQCHCLSTYLCIL